MGRMVVLVMLCGCNSIFALDTTALVDASPDSPAIDARPPPVCPAIGTGVPRFREELHQIPVQHCASYAIGGNEAMAHCDGTVSRGPIDSPLQKAIDDALVYYPRLSADGTRAIMTYYNTTNGRWDMAEYVIAPDSATRLTTYTTTDANYSFAEFSTPSLGPDRRIVYSVYDYSSSAAVVIELSDPGTGTWTELRRYPLTELGTIYTMMKPWISRDGLRLLFVSYAQQTGGGEGDGGEPTRYEQPVMYSERASLDDHFGPAVILESVPDLVQWPYMTDDCGRIYFNALNRVFYLEQLR